MDQKISGLYLLTSRLVESPRMLRLYRYVYKMRRKLWALRHKKIENSLSTVAPLARVDEEQLESGENIYIVLLHCNYRPTL